MKETLHIVYHRSRTPAHPILQLVRTFSKRDVKQIAALHVAVGVGSSIRYIANGFISRSRIARRPRLRTRFQCGFDWPAGSIYDRMTLLQIQRAFYSRPIYASLLLLEIANYTLQQSLARFQSVCLCGQSNRDACYAAQKNTV